MAEEGKNKSGNSTFATLWSRFHDEIERRLAPTKNAVNTDIEEGRKQGFSPTAVAWNRWIRDAGDLGASWNRGIQNAGGALGPLVGSLSAAPEAIKAWLTLKPGETPLDLIIPKIPPDPGSKVDIASKALSKAFDEMLKLRAEAFQKQRDDMSEMKKSREADQPDWMDLPPL